jgi:hypothetical protein
MTQGSRTLPSVVEGIGGTPLNDTCLIVSLLTGAGLEFA